MSIPSRPQNHVSKRFESKVRATSISVVVGGGVAILFPTFISTKERRASLGGEVGGFCKVSGSKVNECVDDHFLSPTRNQNNMWFAVSISVPAKPLGVRSPGRPHQPIRQLVN